MLFCVFELFTEQARRVVVSAQEHARALNHGYIGSEHLLLAVASDGGEVPTELLGAVGVNVDTVRAAVIKRVGVGEERPDGFIPFTPRARRAFELAVGESSELGHNDVSSGHVLLGLMRLREGMAVRVLVDLDVPWEQLGAGLLARLRASGAEEGLRRPGDARGPRSLALRDRPHRGPPDSYLVTCAVSPGEVPDDVRGLADDSLGRFGFTFDDVVFVAQVRDADVTETPGYPEWLVAVHGPISQLGMIVRTVGSWGASSNRTAFGDGESGTLLRVLTVDRVEVTPGRRHP